MTDAKNRSDVTTAIGIVVALVLFSIAYPAFTKYALRSKTREAETNLRQLASSYVTACNEGRVDGDLTAGPLPAVPTAETQEVDWSAEPAFVALSFAPSTPVRYSYSIGPSPIDAGDIVFQARGDLDGNGAQSLFELACRPSECRCADAPYFENELE